MQGTLSPTYGVADIVKSVYVRRRSGILGVSRGELRKHLYFDRGSFVMSDTNEESCRLGDILVQQGKIEREALEAFVESMPAGWRIGAALVEAGVTDAQTMAATVEYQITENVYPVFAWSDGEFEFEEKEQPVESDIALAISTANVIMEGTRRIDDPKFIRTALVAIDRAVTLADDPLLRFQAVFLKPMEGFILSRIDGVLTVEEVCAICPVPEDDVLRCLYGLKSTGILEIRPRDESEAVFEEQGDVASFFVDFAGTEDFLGASGLSSDEVQLTEEERKEFDQIEQLAATIEELDHHTVLGIEPGADQRAIRRAYYRLAKKYHPDRHHRTHLGELQETFERIFVRVHEAYETLRQDRGTPAETAQGVRRGGPRRQTAKAKSDDVRDPKADSERRMKTAASRFKDGKHFFDQGDTFAAIQVFRTAVLNEPDNPQYLSYLGRALGQNPKWRKEAEARLLRAAELQPSDAEHYAQLGLLYQRAGLGPKAERCYTEALRWDPDNETAQAGAESIGLAKKRESGLAGTFRAIFRDRSK